MSVPISGAIMQDVTTGITTGIKRICGPEDVVSSETVEVDYQAEAPLEGLEEGVAKTSC